MLVWNLLDPRGAGVGAGLLAAGVFAIPAVALWRARDLFDGNGTVLKSDDGSLPEARHE